MGEMGLLMDASLEWVSIGDTTLELLRDAPFFGFGASCNVKESVPTRDLPSFSCAVAI
jgi:hypothetical protein